MNKHQRQTAPTTKVGTLETSSQDAETKSNTLTAEDLERQDDIKIDEILNDPATFQIALGKAQMDGAEYLEVSKPLFRFLTSGMKTPYILYGNPAIKVYEQGTRETADKMDARSTDQILSGVKY